MMRSLVDMEAKADGHVKDLARYMRHIKVTWILHNIATKEKVARFFDDSLEVYKQYSEHHAYHAAFRVLLDERIVSGLCDRSLIGC